MSPEPIVSAVILGAMVTGVALRRRPRVHVPLMWAVIVADLALLLWVETQARAIATVVGGGLPAYLWVHVGFAVACVVGYGIAIGAGIALFRNPASRWPPLHRVNGWTVLAARVGLLATTPGLFFPPLVSP